MSLPRSLPTAKLAPWKLFKGGSTSTYSGPRLGALAPATIPTSAIIHTYTMARLLFFIPIVIATALDLSVTDFGCEIPLSEHCSACSQVLQGFAENESYCTYNTAGHFNVHKISIDRPGWSQELLGSPGPHIISESWGCVDNGVTACLHKPALQERLTDLLTHGAILVHPAGNGGENDDCAMDTYTQHRGIITVTPTGYTRAERCSATLVTVTIPRNVTILLDGHCTKIPMCSSMAVPLLGNLLGRVLRATTSGARPENVQWALVRASRPHATTGWHGRDWELNAVTGRWHHPRYGFGEPDPEETGRELRRLEESYPPHEFGEWPLEDCAATLVDWITLSVTITPATYRGAVTLDVQSPSGTHVAVLGTRPLDVATGEFTQEMVTNRFWGEPGRNGSAPWTVMCKGCGAYNIWGFCHGIV
ncbi:subtilisin-like proprotein convertase [Silurid herpesvirus 1]|nr:subtilisin-like proprotein convertase [Silurid herpesvirus 1]